MHRVGRVLLSRAPTVRASFHTATFTANSQAKSHLFHKPTLLTAAGVVVAGGYYAWNTQKPVYAEAQQQGYAGTVEDPNTKLAFPVHLSTGGGSEWKRLIGLGARQVSFLNLNVYVLGLYMRSQDIGALKSIKGWEKFDKEEFLAHENMANALLEQPVDVSIRIVPVRATNTQHLRDGFTRSLLQRMRDQDLTEDEERDIMKGIQEFKTTFPSGKVKKGAEFVFTKTSDGGLKMEYEGKDMGTVANKWLAINFMMGYLNPTTPASEHARQDIASGFEKLLCNEE
ncbi:chalcone-flavanone isomerase-domain-containing protein [Phascolomyces articulosus]|uniref:Chalcone-flavanone isomerase-domain-containing protein n=1 Tax=Phascolomyces articulosus TaxID=60185 RepID=A0AAD5K3F4_9FUNG|nr:chalcone-flavanone isomerase-domain-containing protein [Phascolomyces articulosus]